MTKLPNKYKLTINKTKHNEQVNKFYVVMAAFIHWHKVVSTFPFHFKKLFGAAAFELWLASCGRHR